MPPESYKRTKSIVKVTYLGVSIATIVIVRISGTIDKKLMRGSILQRPVKLHKTKLLLLFEERLNSPIQTSATISRLNMLLLL